MWDDINHAKIFVKIEYIETNIKFLRGLIKIYSFKINNN